jgi:hypothetical protein
MDPRTGGTRILARLRAIWPRPMGHRTPHNRGLPTATPLDGGLRGGGGKASRTGGLEGSGRSQQPAILFDEALALGDLGQAIGLFRIEGEPGEVAFPTLDIVFERLDQATFHFPVLHRGPGDPGRWRILDGLPKVETC